MIGRKIRKETVELVWRYYHGVKLWYAFLNEGSTLTAEWRWKTREKFLKLNCPNWCEQGFLVRKFFKVPGLNWKNTERERGGDREREGKKQKKQKQEKKNMDITMCLVLVSLGSRGKKRVKQSCLWTVIDAWYVSLGSGC